MLEVFRETWRRFRAHDGPLLSGAVAFYMLLAVAPIGVFAVAITGALLGEEAAEGELMAPLQSVLGEEAARSVSDLIERASEPGSTWVATVFGGLFFLFAVVRLFSILQSALNHIWGVRSRGAIGFKGKAWRVLRKRMLAFSMVIVLGLSMFLFVAAKTALVAAQHAVGGPVPLLWRVLELAISLGAGTLLNAMVFRYLPDVRIGWRDVFLGAFVTTLFSALGALVIGQYLGRASVASSYGAAGSIVLLLLWVYYTAQIFFLGAQFTGAWARHKGHGVIVLPHAVPLIEEDERATIEPPTRITLLDDELPDAQRTDPPLDVPPERGDARSG